MSPTYKFIVTAEHASAEIPNSLKLALQNFAATCQTHQTFDPGSKAIAEEIAHKLDCPLVLGEYSRLAIDLNRSTGNPSQFSPIVYDLCESEKVRLLSEIYIPFREETRRCIEAAQHEDCTVVHLSIHSFTKTFEGCEREVDLGILFDDTRPAEESFCKKLLKLLKIVLPELNIRLNEPYHGREDGHTTALRKRYPQNQYIGIELEFSQALDLDLDGDSYAAIISKAIKAVAR